MLKKTYNIGMIQKLKDGLSADVYLIGKEQNQNNFFVVALADKKQVGYCCFEIVKDECKIVRIAVTNQKYLSKGLGNAMFKTMENFAYSQGAKYVSGIFVARGYENASEQTAKFYESQGFVPECDDFVEREELFKHIKTEHKGFETPVKYNQKIYDKLAKYNFEENDFFSTKESITKSEPEIDL